MLCIKLNFFFCTRSRHSWWPTLNRLTNSIFPWLLRILFESKVGVPPKIQDCNQSLENLQEEPEYGPYEKFYRKPRIFNCNPPKGISENINYMVYNAWLPTLAFCFNRFQSYCNQFCLHSLLLHWRKLMQSFYSYCNFSLSKHKKGKPQAFYNENIQCKILFS